VRRRFRLPVALSDNRSRGKKAPARIGNDLARPLLASVRIVPARSWL
jgi:hypothetical protein